MNKHEIKVGGHYVAEVSGKLTTVRVDEVIESHYNQRIGRHFTGGYKVTNLATGRKTSFRSAAKFRQAIDPRKVEKYGIAGAIAAEEMDAVTEVARPGVGEPASIREAQEAVPEDSQGDDSRVPTARVAGPPATGAAPTSCTESDTSKDAQRTRCPRCGRTVAIVNDCYDYHRKPSGITCGNSGEKVKAEATEFGPNEAFEEGFIKYPISEGEHRQSPPSCGSGSGTSIEGDEGCVSTIQSQKEGENCPDPTITDALIVGSSKSILGVTAQSAISIASKIAATRTGREIGSPVAGMVPNEEQESILAAAVEQGLRVLVIAAGAGCLAGDTIIHINRATKGFQLPIRDLVARQSGERPVITRTYQMHGKIVTSTQRNHPWDIENIPTRVARAEGGVIRLCDLAKVWYSGDKETFTLTTTSGRTIRATAIHPFLTGNGEWVQLQSLKPGDALQVNSGRSTKGRGGKPRYHQTSTRYHPHQVSRSNSRYRMSVATHRLLVEADMNLLTFDEYIWVLNHDEKMATELQYLSEDQLVHHVNGNTLDNSGSNLKVVEGQKEHSEDHQWGNNVLWQVGFDIVESIEPYGIEPTYDIEVVGDPHNFVANGFVVHNTGKTATLKMLEQVLPGKGQYTAFNTSLCAESKAKFVKCAVNTTHSLAFRAVGKQYQHRLGGERMRSEQVAYILGIEPLTVTLKGAGAPDADGKPTDKEKILRAEFLAGQVLTAIKKFCQSADHEIGEQHFHYIEGIDAPREGMMVRDNNLIVRKHLLLFAQKAWMDLSRVDGQLPYAHDYYVKTWQLGQGDDRPIIASDYILIDEAQDLAPVFLSILQQQAHALLILVGDDCQQIYEWRGACNAMKAYPDAPRRLLSQSYRFGQAIADAANTILAELDEPTDLVMRGMPTIPSRVAPVAEPRCFLYRTNAGAIGRVMAAIAAGKRPHLIGGGDEVVRWMQAAMDLQARKGTRHPELCCFDTWGEVVEYSKTDEGGDMRLMVKLVTEFGAARIRDALRNMPKEDDADLVVSTAHKSKGREWDTVRLGQDFPTVNKMNDADRRLLYVAATRAKLTLDISECPPFCGGQERAGEDGSDGGWVLGMRVEYTGAMPSTEEQAAWIGERGGTLLTTTTPPTNGKLAPSTQAPSSTPAELPAWTWGKWNGRWCLRGPRGIAAGTSVEVVKKDGRISRERVGKVVKEFAAADAALYGVGG